PPRPPPRQTRRAGLPPRAFLSASCQGLWDLSCRGRFQPWLVPTDPVAVEQPEPLVQPPPTPPPPTEAPALPGAHQMPPHLLLHPVADEREAAARVADREVVHPAPEDRVDQLNHPAHRLRFEAPGDLPALPPPPRTPPH